MEVTGSVAGITGGFSEPTANRWKIEAAPRYLQPVLPDFSDNWPLALQNLHRFVANPSFTGRLPDVGAAKRAMSGALDPTTNAAGLQILALVPTAAAAAVEKDGLGAVDAALAVQLEAFKATRHLMGGQRTGFGAAAKEMIFGARPAVQMTAAQRASVLMDVLHSIAYLTSKSTKHDKNIEFVFRALNERAGRYALTRNTQLQLLEKLMGLSAYYPRAAELAEQWLKDDDKGNPSNDALRQTLSVVLAGAIVLPNLPSSMQSALVQRLFTLEEMLTPEDIVLVKTALSAVKGDLLFVANSTKLAADLAALDERLSTRLKRVSKATA